MNENRFRIPEEAIRKMGRKAAEIFKHEALKEFAKRGWSAVNPSGEKILSQSFDYRIKDGSIEVISDFDNLENLMHGYDDSNVERAIGKVRSSDLSAEGKAAVIKKLKIKKKHILPLTTSSGEVIFKALPLQTPTSWIHPGIYKYHFGIVAQDKVLDMVRQVMTEEAHKIASSL